ncbi:MAG: hypothetical protein DI551_11495, partial [Micavibrio aeruginosavorus]
MQGFAHAYVSSQIADDFTPYLGAQNANNFSRFIGEVLEKFTHNDPTTFNIRDENRDLWNNDYGLDNLVGLSKEGKVSALSTEINNYISGGSTNLIFDWENDVRVYGRDDIAVSPDALIETILLNDFFDDLLIKKNYQVDFFGLDHLNGMPVDMVGSINSVQQSIHSVLNSASQQASPLVLDLDGDGIELSALNGAGSVYWDIDQDGMAEASGWVKPDDGLLALDWNGDGMV